MNTTIKTGDKVFEIAFRNLEVKITEMEVLCVGEFLIFVSGRDAFSDYKKETIFSPTKINTVDPSVVAKSSYNTFYADSFEKAEELQVTIERILEFKSSFNIAS